MRFSVTSRWRRPSRMHFSVRVRSQNALFRRVRFSSPAQTWSHLTQRRILRRRSHVKAQSAPATSRKGALCATARMQNAPFGEARTQNALFRGVARPECAFPWRRPPGMRFSVRVTPPRMRLSVTLRSHRPPRVEHLCTLLRRDSPRRQPTLTPEEP